MEDNDLISRSALKAAVASMNNNLSGVQMLIDNAAAVDAVEVVRCRDCKHGVWNEAEEMYQCVEGADYDPELAMYHGFICYEEADFFCKRGERRADDGR